MWFRDPEVSTRPEPTGRMWRGRHRNRTVRAVASMSTGHSVRDFALRDQRWIERTMMGFWDDRFGTHAKEARLSPRADVWKTCSRAGLECSRSSGDVELGFLQCVVTISLVCTGMVSPRWGHQEETRSVGVQGERKGAWPLDAPPPPTHTLESTRWEGRFYHSTIQGSAKRPQGTRIRTDRGVCVVGVGRGEQQAQRFILVGCENIRADPGCA